jgi:hypothetical protein
MYLGLPVAVEMATDATLLIIHRTNLKLNNGEDAVELYGSVRVSVDRSRSQRELLAVWAFDRKYLIGNN